MQETTIIKMKNLAQACMGDSPAYCQASCPMHTDVKAYIGLASQGRFKEALDTIREKLFLPACMGRICAHPCEDACKRNEQGQALSVAGVKRFLADNYDQPERWNTQLAPARAEKVAIIGAGPAGAQAALDLAYQGFQVEIFDRLPVVGGMMRVGIPAYRLPRDIIDFEYALLRKLGVQFHLSVELGRDIHLNDLQRQFQAVVLATGLHRGFIPKLPGMDQPEVIEAVSFLKQASLQADQVPVGRHVVVVGGGNVALDAARTARRLGQPEVHLVCLEKDIHSMPAHAWEVEQALEEGVQVHYGWGLIELDSDPDAYGIKALRLQRCTHTHDSEGRFNPSYDSLQTVTLATDQLIFAIGQRLDDLGLENLAKTERGLLAADTDTLQIGSSNVFVAGDASGHSVIAVEALAEGRKAAISVTRLLNQQALSLNRALERAWSTNLQTQIKTSDGQPQRLVSQARPASERILDFKEVDLGLGTEDVLQETSRCLQCECKLCVKECLMLQDFAPQSPARLFNEACQGQLDPLAPYSCTLCGVCTLVCPKSLDIKGTFMAIRKDLVKANGGLSPIAGHKVLYMHQRLGFSKFFNIGRPAKEEISS